MTLSLGFRGEFSTGWNEAHGRASTYTFSNGVISNLPPVGNNTFTTNNAKFLPEPRIGLAWSPSRTGRSSAPDLECTTNLQDALGYRMDQNAPFNPTYSIALSPCLSFPFPHRLLCRKMPFWCREAFSPILKMPTLISYSLRVEQAIGQKYIIDHGIRRSHGYHEVIGIDANHRCRPFVPVRLARRYTRVPFRGRLRTQPFRPAAITFLLERQRRIRPWRIPGHGSLLATVATTRSRSTSIAVSATICLCVAFTHGQRPSMTGIR